jgi:hypothetical protein
MIPFICQVTENRGLHCSNCSATIGPGHHSPLSAPVLGVRFDSYLPHFYFVCIIVPGSWIVIHADILKSSRFWVFGFGIASSLSSKILGPRVKVWDVTGSGLVSSYSSPSKSNVPERKESGHIFSKFPWGQSLRDSP